MTAGEVGGATCGIERWRKTPWKHTQVVKDNEWNSHKIKKKIKKRKPTNFADISLSQSVAKIWFSTFDKWL